METEQKIKDRKNDVPTFKSYLDKCLEKYGQDSKEYLIALLYSLFTVRDNFQLIFTDNVKSDDNKRNFLVNNGQDTKIIINDFKTKKKRHKNKIVWTLDKTDDNALFLDSLLHDYINKNNIKYGQYVFGNQKLSKFVSNMNKELGYPDFGGVNNFRHMRVSEFMNGNPSYEEREKLADEMAHSMVMQDAYKRGVIVTGEK
jgi:hypothetical protein